jgi:hypothetical protein
MKVPQKVKIVVLFDSDIPLLGIYQKEMKSAYDGHAYILTFIVALFIKDRVRI